ncbi:MAG: SBBP repeat-containing protein [Candidatus Zixiibacteriota bacterium]
MARNLLISFVLLLVSVPASAEVEIAWTRHYSASEPGKNYASSIAIDDSGNVYVTGLSEAPETMEDYATLKYYPDGDLAWIRLYNGPADSNDQATDIAVDAVGNSYVTGWSFGNGTDKDYCTIKYDQDGNELWVARYDGPNNWWDFASALAVDGEGNVYVTGWSSAKETAVDYTTIRYDSAGTLLWTRRYDGMPRKSWDRALDLALDRAGNIHVTGESGGRSSEPVDLDWDTIRTEIWFVMPDYVTVKYDPLGNENWVNRYGGPANSLDEVYAIAVDDSGNVHVTGSSDKFKGKPGDGWSLASGYATVKYYRDGKEAWISRYDARGCIESGARAIAVDQDGNVFVTGRCGGGPETNNDYLTVAYDKYGKELWSARYNGPDNESDQAEAVDLDASGNVYVAGTSQNFASNLITIVKYSPEGNQLWVERSPGKFRDMVIDNAGSIYITGTVWLDNYNSTYVTMKLVQEPPPSPQGEPSPGE